MAGNGGEMVLKSNRKGAKEAGAQEPAARSGKSRRAVKRKGAEEEAETGGAGAGGKDRPRRSNKNGADLLKQAADRELVKIAEKVAVQLKEKALDGDVASVKTLVGFSEERKAAAKPRKSGRNMAFIKQLESDVQWEWPKEEEEYIWRDSTDRFTEHYSGPRTRDREQGVGNRE